MDQEQLRGLLFFLILLASPFWVYYFGKFICRTTIRKRSLIINRRRNIVVRDLVRDVGTTRPSRHHSLPTKAMGQNTGYKGGKGYRPSTSRDDEDDLLIAAGILASIGDGPDRCTVEDDPTCPNVSCPGEFSGPSSDYSPSYSYRSSSSDYSSPSSDYSSSSSSDGGGSSGGD
jgi:uncharacterized membrane protein YgcG